jgi:hypothetical protein
MSKAKMKKLILPLAAYTLLSASIGCGDSSKSQSSQAPDPATQPEAQATLFLRSSDRARSLIASKDFKQAQETIDLLKSFKLTDEQKKIVEQLQAQIPKSN